MLKKTNQKGFTLIEIIAVLVILGILAAVAIPKVFDLQELAKVKAMQAALAEGMSTMSMGYGKLLFSNAGSATTAQVATKATANTPVSDEFVYTFAATGLVTVSGKAGTGFAGVTAQTKQWSKQ